MFNYPVKILNDKLISPIQLKIQKDVFWSVFNEEKKGKKYQYDFKFNESFSSTFEQSKLWFLLNVSRLHFEPSLNWINFPKSSLIPKILNKSFPLIQKEQIKLVTKYINSRPEDEHIEYIESTLLSFGIFGIIKSITELECMHIDFAKTHYPKYKNKIINSYYFDDFNHYAYKFQLDSLIEPFLIKTDGFNQCFNYNEELYSSVVVLTSQKQYKIYIFGCDDSSYSKYFDSLKDVDQDIHILKTLSTCINKNHILKLGYIFTN